MKEEEGRHNVAIEAFNVNERSIQELKNKLLEEEGDEKVLQLPLIVLRGRLRVKRCSFATQTINWPPPKLRSLPLRRSWRRPRR